MLNDADLVADLRAAENRDKRSRRIAHGLAHVFELFLHEQAGGGFLHKFRDANGRCVRPVGCAKGVVHIKLSQLGQFFRELFVVGFFFRMKTQILEQQSLSALQIRCHFHRLLAHAVRTEAHVLALSHPLVEKNPQALGHRLQAVFGIDLTLRSPQMRGQNQLRAVS